MGFPLPTLIPLFGCAVAFMRIDEYPYGIDKPRGQFIQWILKNAKVFKTVWLSRFYVVRACHQDACLGLYQDLLEDYRRRRGRPLPSNDPAHLADLRLAAVVQLNSSQAHEVRTYRGEIATVSAYLGDTINFPVIKVEVLSRRHCRVTFNPQEVLRHFGYNECSAVRFRRFSGYRRLATATDSNGGPIMNGARRQFTGQVYLVSDECRVLKSARSGIRRDANRHYDKHLFTLAGGSFYAV